MIKFQLPGALEPAEILENQAGAGLAGRAVLELGLLAGTARGDVDELAAAAQLAQCTGAEPKTAAQLARGPAADQVAISGIGVALGLSPVVADALADGRLVAPFKTRIPARDAHFVVTPEDAVDRAEALAFRAWLIAEARGEDAAKPARGKRRAGN